MKKTLNQIFKQLFTLIISVQLIVVTPSGAQAHWLESYDGEEFNADINDFIAFYKSQNKINGLNEKEIRSLIATKGYEEIMNSWDQEFRNISNPKDSDAQAAVLLRAKEVAPAIRSRAMNIIDKMYRDSIISREPNPDQFNQMMFDLYSRFINEPSQVPALDAFFRVLVAYKFNNEQRVTVDAQRTLWGNMNENFLISFGALLAGTIVYKKWPNSWRITNALKGRFPTRWAKLAQESQKIAPKPSIIARTATAGKKKLDSMGNWIYSKLPVFMRQTPKPAAPILALPSPFRATEFHGTNQVSSALAREFTEKFKRQPSAAELAQFKKEAEAISNKVKGLNIDDSAVLKDLYVKVEIFVAQKGRLPNAQTELPELHKRAVERVATDKSFFTTRITAQPAATTQAAKPAPKKPGIVQSFTNWITKKLAPAAKPVAKPILPSPERVASTEGHTGLAKTLGREFFERNKRQPTQAELIAINKNLASLETQIKALNISDAVVLKELYIEISMFTNKLGRLPNSKDELAGLLAKSKTIVAETRQLNKAISTQPVAAAATSNAAKPKVVLKVKSALKELVLRHTQKILERRKELTFRDVIRFMGATVKRGGKVVGATLAADLAISTVTLQYYKLPNGTHSLIPKDDLDRGINALAVLQLSCSSETLSNKASALAQKVRLNALSETGLDEKGLLTDQKNINNEFAGLVTEIKDLASSYSLLLKIANQYAPEEDMLTLSDANIKHDIKTGKIGYYQQHEGKTYPAEFVCPTRIGKKFEYIKLTDARIALAKTLDKLTTIDVMNSTNAASAVALKDRNAARLMAVNPVDYNKSVQLLVDREFIGDESVTPLLNTLDAMLASPLNIANKDERKTAASLRQTRNRERQQAGL